jgi:molybdopterin synthase sulfur carrier subunit
MPVTVKLPTPLRRHAGGSAELVREAASVAELVAGLERDFPGLRGQLTEGGRLRRFINVYRNGEDVRALEREGTALADGDVVTLIAAIAGG